MGPKSVASIDSWHLWFAWKPIRTTVGQPHIVWLEVVWRRRQYIACHPCGEYEWQYEAKDHG